MCGSTGFGTSVGLLLRSTGLRDYATAPGCAAGSSAAGEKLLLGFHSRWWGETFEFSYGVTLAMACETTPFSPSAFGTAPLTRGFAVCAVCDPQRIGRTAPQMIPPFQQHRRVGEQSPGMLCVKYEAEFLHVILINVGDSLHCKVSDLPPKTYFGKMPAEGARRNNAK